MARSHLHAYGRAHAKHKIQIEDKWTVTSDNHDVASSHSLPMVATAAHQDAELIRRRMPAKCESFLLM